jgi:hypothetical protein
MKKRKNSRKYRIRAAIVAAAAAAALTAATGSYAAYTHLGFVKGVIATQGKSGLAFSSNYLNAYDSGADTSQYGTRLIAFGGTDNPSFTVSVCNYPQGDLSNINETNISYLFRATLVDVNGNNITSLTDLSGYSVAVSSQTVSFTKTDTAIVCEIDSRTLQGGAENGDRHIYTISMGTEPDQNIYVRLEAIPSDDASQQAAGGKKLARILGFTDAASAGASTSWSGTFTKDADTPGALSAFNYELNSPAAISRPFNVLVAVGVQLPLAV